MYVYESLHDPTVQLKEMRKSGHLTILTNSQINIRATSSNSERSRIVWNCKAAIDQYFLRGRAQPCVTRKI